ncbi:DEAD/DEAH box helicase [Vibrio sp. SS-MA-C1-2]|uniref:DEAD/DEAH box helicase n=1 Tax=Vibrio sp. SS-MA-C1-2 TaxID=2908646 RepID=UPI001F1EBF43|nr:DEAD/DEAH box helicase [Vibrio sp. SS-MA-C1-2]UJF17603.1 DEAD/DEAH box helicase [Vibrio sp. SS-MA-C1-2]
MRFEDLAIDKRLMKPLHHLGLSKPTEIQELAIPVAVAGKDIIASSKTGSGKTLAFLLPALHRIIRMKAVSRRDPRVLILTPTRELAKQVFGQLKLMSAHINCEIALIVGGENFNDQANAFRKNPTIVVGTPGRVADHMSHRHVYFGHLELLIFDEADRMLDLGFAGQLREINGVANHRRRQTLMFSATLDNTEVNELAGELLKDPKRIAVGSAGTEHKDIEQNFYLCDHLDHKQAILQKLIDNAEYNQMMVFTATRADTDRLTALFNEQGLKAVALSGDLNQAARNRIMSQFERRVYRILVTTDIASRGLDIRNVSHVINFDMPKHAEEYVHRVGRTGRAGEKGEAHSLVGPKDWLSFKNVEAFLQQSVDFSTIEGLEGKFKGLKPKPKKVWQKKKPQAKHKKSTAKSADGKKQYNKRFYDNQDVGDVVFQPKKKKPAEDK